MSHAIKNLEEAREQDNKDEQKASSDGINLDQWDADQKNLEKAQQELKETQEKLEKAQQELKEAEERLNEHKEKK